jgi:DNA polymerase-3 subunit delta
MQLKADALGGHLARGKLARLYAVSGDEPLLAIEAADAIRAAARAAGFEERTVLHADARFDWSLLAQAGSGLSLFAGKTFIDLRLPGGKPGRTGGDALQAHAAALSEDSLTLVTLPRLDTRTRKGGWAAALEAAGVWVDVPKVERAELSRWLTQRLARQKQHAGSEALEFIADRVEGNLLAAQQELAKLALLYPEGELALEQITDSVLNVARYDVFALPATVLSGDASRALRQIEGLAAEGAPLPLALWTLHEEVRTLVALRDQMNAGQPFSMLARSYRIWGRESLVERALQRVPSDTLLDWLARCAAIEKLAKGLRPRELCDDAWVEIAALAREMAAAVSATPPRRTALPA